MSLPDYFTSFFSVDFFQKAIIAWVGVGGIWYSAKIASGNLLKSIKADNDKYEKESRRLNGINEKETTNKLRYACVEEIRRRKGRISDILGMVSELKAAISRRDDQIGEMFLSEDDKNKRTKERLSTLNDRARLLFERIILRATEEGDVRLFNKAVSRSRYAIFELLRSHYSELNSSNKDTIDTKNSTTWLLWCNKNLEYIEDSVEMSMRMMDEKIYEILQEDDGDPSEIRKKIVFILSNARLQSFDERLPLASSNPDWRPGLPDGFFDH